MTTLSNTKNQKGFIPVTVIFALIVLLLAGGYYFYTQKSGQNPASSFVTQVKPNKTPYEELEVALNKTISAKTAYVEYKMKDTGRLTFTKTGITQNIEANVDGYSTGSTDGKTSKGEIRISSPENPGVSINVSVISAENGDIYIKGGNTQGKWKKFTKEEFDKENEKTPTDASLYAFSMIDTIFSENKALFKTIRKDTVEKAGTQVIDGKTFEKYIVEISTPDYISAVIQDKKTGSREKKDVREILADATVKVTFLVDKSSNYITKLTIDAKRLAIVKTPEGEQLGISAAYDSELNADLSRFDMPTNITLPNPKELLDPETTT